MTVKYVIIDAEIPADSRTMSANVKLSNENNIIQFMPLLINVTGLDMLFRVWPTLSLAWQAKNHQSGTQTISILLISPKI